MILIDDRIGSSHLHPLIEGSQIERLEYGDVAFEAHGKLVGIEVKRITDAVSSLLSGRLVDHQVPGMLSMYDHNYLIIEGYYRCDAESGLVQGWQGSSWRDIHSGRQSLSWQSLDNWLTSVEILGGIHVRRTITLTETVRTIKSLYSWWQRDDHRSLKVFNTAADAAAIDRPGLLRRMAAQLPQIGWERSIEVARKFKTVERMANADEGDWTSIEGIGKGIASKVVKAIRGE
jgi:ERCC4-type nuclease